MKAFMDQDFLLTTPTAKKLFEACRAEPIFDWHCHLSPQEIWDNEQPADIAQLWLAGDHYKWRAMRSCGIDERYITGDASGWEKFEKWASVMEVCIGNPLYHWTHLELQRYFGIDEPLNSRTAERIWNEANAKIASGGFRPRDLIERSGVVCVCTTDDPADSLEYHALLRANWDACAVRPAFRPDKALNIAAPDFADWVARLEKAAGVRADSFASLKAALKSRIDFFAEMGCLASDHSFSTLRFVPYTDAQADAVFRKALAGEPVTDEEYHGYVTALFRFLAQCYREKGWATEIHLCAMRNNNTRMFRAIGPDTGFDSVGDGVSAIDLSRLLDAIEQDGGCPKTILFPLNPADNYIIGAMLGNFQGTEARGKMQMGSGWWFNDNIDGMRDQMHALANLGMLGLFVGMITDSRSFLSYPRHEYFRRILCEFLGSLVENGEYPFDEAVLTTMVRNISYGNAAAYFGIGEAYHA